MRSVRPLLLACLVFALVAGMATATPDKGLSLLQASLKGSELDVTDFLRPLRSFRDRDGNDFHAYQRYVQGIPVFGETRMVVFPAKAVDDARLPGLRDLLPEEIAFMRTWAKADLEAMLPLSKAETIAMRHLRSRKEASALPLPEHLLRETTLCLYRAGGRYHLVYHLVMAGVVRRVPTSIELFIDARTGDIVDRTTGIFDAVGTGLSFDATEPVTFPIVIEEDGTSWMRDEVRNLDVYLPKGDWKKHCTDADGVWDREGPERKDNQRAEVQAYRNMGKVIDFYKTHFGFVWYRGLVSAKTLLHYQQFGEDYNNAFYNSWDGCIYFGDGTGTTDGYDYFSKALDITAHEFMHGVLVQRSPLNYSYDSGTVNEHIADVSGSWLDPEDWTISEDIVLGHENAMRDMKDPTRGHPELLKPGMTYDEWWAVHDGATFAVYPDRMSLLIKCANMWQDAGGVHLNSGILNRFYYLAVTGDGLETAGVGRDRMRDLYWRLIEDKYLPSNCSFAEFRNMVFACAGLHFHGQEDYAEVLRTLQEAFTKIEL